MKLIRYIKLLTSFPLLGMDKGSKESITQKLA